MAGRFIRQFRERESLTLDALAARINAQIAPGSITRQAVCAWETEGKVARPAVQRALQDMGVCYARHWLQADDQAQKAA